MYILWRSSCHVYLQEVVVLLDEPSDSFVAKKIFAVLYKIIFQQCSIMQYFFKWNDWLFESIYYQRKKGNIWCHLCCKRREKTYCLLKRLILFMEKDNYKGFIERLTMKDRHEKQKGSCNLMWLYFTFCTERKTSKVIHSMRSRIESFVKIIGQWLIQSFKTLKTE